jgi:hypothetical protein
MVAQLVKKFLSSYGDQMFMTAPQESISDPYLYPVDSSYGLIHFCPIHFNIILTPLFVSMGFPTKIYAFVVYSNGWWPISVAVRSKA